MYQIILYGFIITIYLQNHHACILSTRMLFSLAVCVNASEVSNDDVSNNTDTAEENSLLKVHDSDLSELFVCYHNCVCRSIC